MSSNHNFSYKLVGAIQGRVKIQNSTVGALRNEVLRLLGDPDVTIKMIAKGKRLQDDEKQLSEYGALEGCQVMILTQSSCTTNDLTAQEEQSRQLSNIQRAVQSVATGSRSSGPNIWIENQHGQEVRLSRIDREVITSTLLLHHKARSDMAKSNFKLALQELLLCEQGIQLCTPSIAQCVDNVALILLDLVWCSYKLQDINQLGVSIARLEQVRKILDKQYSEARLVQAYGSVMMVAPVYLRLEMLEGMAAYYAGEKEVAKDKLASAKKRWDQLQVLPQDQSELLGMGFEQDEVVKALRLTGRDKSRALELIMRHREEKKALQQRESQRKQQAKFGRTKDGNYVNLEYIERLKQLGYSKPLAAEALRTNENDFEKALDLLCDPKLLKRPQMKKLLNEEVAAFASSITSEMLHVSSKISNTPNVPQNDSTHKLGDPEQTMEFQQGSENITNSNHVQDSQNVSDNNSIESEMEDEAHDEQNSREEVAPTQEDLDMEDLFQKIQDEEPLDVYFQNLDDEIEVIVGFLSSLENNS